MSSHQLVLHPEPSISRYVPSVTTPIYITFSAEDDTVGVLWEHGYIELWSLKVRLGPGNDKIMDPRKVWSGWVIQNDESTNSRFRQLAVKVVNDSYSITLLGTDEASNVDSISFATIERGSLKHHEVKLLP